MKSSIQKKIMLLSLSGLLICTILLGGLCTIFVNNLTERNSRQFLEDQANYAVAQISGKFFNVEMYTNALYTAGIAKEFKNIDEVKNDSIRNIRTKAILEHINATIKNELFSIAVYLRFNPALTPSTSGISMIRRNKNGPMTSIAPTDLLRYAPTDTSHVGSYYIPASSQAPLWLSPYYKNTVNTRVISYAIPLILDNVLYGVTGIDINFDDLTKEISEFKYFHTGYAFLEDSKGKIVFHKNQFPGEVYTDDGTNTIVRRQLRNGMTLAIVAPTSEINEERNKFIMQIILFSVVVLLIFGSLSAYIAKTITRPLKRLTSLANKLTDGDMTVEFDLHQNDEIGELGKSFTKAKQHIQEHLDQMQGLAFSDSLTGMQNKTAYDDFVREFQKKIDANEVFNYGIIIMDTNDLKDINDTYGHENGNIYLINSSKLITDTFRFSQTFRIGGDEFVVVLLDEDFDNYKDLMQKFRQKMDDTQTEKDPWRRISIACGVCICEDVLNQNIRDIFNHADKEMYKDKKAIKKNRASKN